LAFIGVDGKTHNLVEEFLTDEFAMYPVSSHDDMLDCLARILDPSMGISFPTQTQEIPFQIGRNKTYFANDKYDYLRGQAVT
jgi:hypothetical protein